MLSNINQKFGKKLKELRQQHGWSQELLSEKTGLNRNYLSLLELGRKSPTLNTILLIAAGFDMTPIQLLTFCLSELPHATEIDNNNIHQR